MMEAAVRRYYNEPTRPDPAEVHEWLEKLTDLLEQQHALLASRGLPFMFEEPLLTMAEDGWPTVDLVWLRHSTAEALERLR
jgi:hypothetical protein